MMEASIPTDLEEAVLLRIDALGDQLVVPRGKTFAKNVARRLEMSGFNRIRLYEAVLSLEHKGLLARVDKGPASRVEVRKMGRNHPRYAYYTLTEEGRARIASLAASQS